MSGEYKVTHEFDCTEDTFWEKVMFSDAFNHALYIETLKFPGWKVLEQKDDGQKITRKVKIDPPVTGMPGPVQKALGDKFSYVEEGTYDRATRKYTFKATPSTMADKTTIKGVLWTEPKGDAKIARHADIQVEVKVFMIGKMIEEKAITDMRNSYETGAKFTNEYVKTKV